MLEESFLGGFFSVTHNKHNKRYIIKASKWEFSLKQYISSLRQGIVATHEVCLGPKGAYTYTPSVL